jgi:DNA-binding response OmpR family regulator
MKKTSATILVVDDDPKIVKAITLRLKAAGYQTMTSFNGMTALLLTVSKKPDLVITDVWMPAGCGLSLAYRMKELAAEVPFIFLTASKQPGLEQKARELGCAGFLEKPYEPAQLLEMVASLLDARRTAPKPEEPALAEVAG